MNTYTVALRDADEIEEFLLGATGMKPDYLQLSRGLGGLQYRVVEFAGVTLLWARSDAHARWRDQMIGGSLHFGFMIESAGSLTVRGRSADAGHAQVWMAGKEMDYIMKGPLLTLEIGVEADLVEELGWQFIGDPLREVPRDLLSRLVQTCCHASEAACSIETNGHKPSLIDETQSWRDRILDDLEPLLDPWLSDDEAVLPGLSDPRHFHLVRQADDFFDDFDSSSPFVVDLLAASLGVPRRTIFHAYRKLLGIGPRRYFELQKLHILRSRLKQSSIAETSVREIAAELRFTDLGRLPALYRRQFGENPSETLRRV